jgi:hypothetical protein
MAREPDRNGSGGTPLLVSAASQMIRSSRNHRTAPARQVRLKARHFELARAMHARSWPGKGDRRVCKWGQARLGSVLSPPIGARQVANLTADLKAAGLVDTSRRPAGATRGEGGYCGRGRGGNWTVLQFDLAELEALEQAVNAQASGHMPRCPGHEMPAEPVSPAQSTSAAEAVTPVRSNPSQLEVIPSPQVGGGSGGSELAQLLAGVQLGGTIHEPRFYNEHGRRVWVPPEVYLPIKAGLIAANPNEGLQLAESYQAKCQANNARRERMRAAGRAARERERRGELEPRPRPPIDPAALSPEQRRQLAALEAAPGFPEDRKVTGILTGTSRRA